VNGLWWEDEPVDELDGVLAELARWAGADTIER
jgi:hypothetical protein